LQSLVHYYSGVVGDSSRLEGNLIGSVGIGSFFVFVFAVAFGRFLLRAMPPNLSGQTRPRQLAIIAVALCGALIGFLILNFFVVLDAPNITGASDVGIISMVYVLCIAPAAILWAVGAVGPLVLRHRRPRVFLDRPFVLFLRRFSTFSDRTVIALILRQAKAGVPVVFLTPTHSKPRDWDLFLVGFAGLKLLHPLRSVPMVLRARDDDWQRAADELIGRAQTILVDISEASAALRIEAEMIEKTGRWSDTVCLRRTAPTSGSGQDPLGAFSNARCVDYSKSWTRALPRLAISLPITLLAALVAAQQTSTLAVSLPAVIWASLVALVFVAVALVSYSIFWRPAVSRNAKIELKRVLRAEHPPPLPAEQSRT